MCILGNENDISIKRQQHKNIGAASAQPLDSQRTTHING